MDYCSHLILLQLYNSSKQNQYEEIFEGQGEKRIKSSNIKHQRESNNTTQEFSDSVLRQILSLLEDLRNEQDMRKRYKIHIQCTAGNSKS